MVVGSVRVRLLYSRSGIEEMITVVESGFSDGTWCRWLVLRERMMTIL